jgi:hypothetical protein
VTADEGIAALKRDLQSLRDEMEEKATRRKEAEFLLSVLDPVAVLAMLRGRLASDDEKIADRARWYADLSLFSKGPAEWDPGMSSWEAYRVGQAFAARWIATGEQT